jgi:sugar lactone lactonase YvrE
MCIFNFNRASHTNREATLRMRPLVVLVAFAFVSAFTPAASAQANNTIQTVAGGAYSCELVPLGLASLADIPGPTSSARDASGNIYIAAPNSYCVFKMDATGIISVFAGIGIQGFGGEGGPANQAILQLPSAVAVDNVGNVYIADTTIIRKVVADGTIHTIVGNGPACSSPTDPCGDGGPASQAQLTSPLALAVDAQNNLYIADTGDNRIREVSAGIINTIVGDGNLCVGGTNACGDAGPATQAQLNAPAGLALDSSGNIFISDTGDQRVRIVSGGIINKYAGTGQVCPTPTSSCGDRYLAISGKLHSPGGLSLDAAGNLYIADTADNRIRQVTSQSNKYPFYLLTVAGTGAQGFVGDGGAATSAQLNAPLDVRSDAAGNFWITDTGIQRVRAVLASNINTVAGGGSGGDSQQPVNATLANPIGVLWDSTGTNYYIADTANNRIRKVSTNNATITTVVGNGNVGYTGDAGPALNATLNAPNGVALDNAGNLYIADTTNRVIRKVDLAGTITTVVGSGGACTPATAKCGDGGLATKATMVQPTTAAVDAQGNIFIADHWGNKIRCVIGALGGCLGSSLPVGYITTVAGNGLPGYTGDNGPGYKAKVHHPRGIIVDKDGNAYFADAGSSRIRCLIAIAGGCGGFQYPVGTIVTYAFNGKASFCGDGGPALQACMYNPAEVAFDASGNLFVSGGPDQVVRRIDALSRTVWTVAGNPKYPTKIGFGGDGGPATLATLDNWSISVNGSQYLLIADSGNNRIRQVDMVPAVLSTPSLKFGTVPVGQTTPPLPAYMKNTGLADLPISNVAISGANAGDFAVASNTCVVQLAPGIVCAANITFTPQTKGPRNATLIFTDTLGQQTVKLSGAGQ